MIEGVHRSNLVTYFFLRTSTQESRNIVANNSHFSHRFEFKEDAPNKFALPKHYDKNIQKNMPQEVIHQTDIQPAGDPPARLQSRTRRIENAKRPRDPQPKGAGHVLC